MSQQVWRVKEPQGKTLLSNRLILQHSVGSATLILCVPIDTGEKVSTRQLISNEIINNAIFTDFCCL
jgi:hypothetical protein